MSVGIDFFRLGAGIVIGAAGFIPGLQILHPIGLSLILGSISIGGGKARLASRQAGTLISNSQRSDSPIPVVYGTTKLGFVIADKRVDEVSTDNKDLYMPAVICHGSRDGLGIAAIDDVWFNDQLAIDNTGSIQTPFEKNPVSGVNITFADDNPDTITRASGSFVANGYTIGDRVNVSGSASNDGNYTVATVEPDVLTLIAADTLVNEGPSGGITLKALNLAFAKLLGTSAQDFSSTSIGGSTLDTKLSAWTNTDKGAGLAGIIFKFIYDRRIYTQDVPVITAIVKGNHTEDNRSEVSGIDITFASSTKTATRASGSYITDGYVVGDRVEVLNSPGGNNGLKTINTVTALVLTVDETVITEGPSAVFVLKRWAHPSTGGGDNPALCVRDYLLSTVYGAAIPAAQIDEASFNAMANYYDETISVPDDSSGSRNQNRYTCNGWLSTQRSVRQNLEELLSACRGNLIYEGGKYRLFTTRSVTPSTIALTEDNIVGDMEFTNAGNDEKFNVARATIIDPAKSYQPDTIQWPNAGATNTFLTDDNSFEKRLDIDLPFTNEDHMAENILDITLSESRQGIKVVLTANEEALQYQIGDVVPVTHSTPGWTSKNFWVMGIGLLQDSKVRLALVEYDATSYTHGTQQDAEQEPDTNLPDPFTVSAPTSLVLTATAEETGFGSVVLNILATWTDTPEAFIDRYVIEAKRSADAKYDFFGRVEQGVGQFNIRGLSIVPADNQWDVRVSAINTIGARSTFLSGTITSITFRRFVNALSNRQADDRRLGFPADTPADALAIFVFEDGTATTVLNEVVNTDDATITIGAGSAWIEGPAGGAYDFNETAFARATHATAFDIGLTTAFTVDVICRWDANAAATQFLVIHDEDYFLRLTTTGAIEYATRDNWVAQTPGVDLSSSGLDLQGKWIHIHWEYDGADVSTIDINGVLQATHTASAAASAAAISDNLDFGGLGSTLRFNGAIAYVRVVKGARSTFPFLSQVSPNQGVITKTIKVPYAQLLPINNSSTWAIVTSYIRPGTAGVTLDAYGAALMPPGVTITKITAHHYRNDTGDFAILRFIRITDSAGQTTLATLTHSSTGWQTQSATISEMVDPAEGFIIYVQLQGVGNPADARFQYAEIEYEMRDYSKAF